MGIKALRPKDRSKAPHDLEMWHFKCQGADRNKSFFLHSFKRQTVPKSSLLILSHAS